jgi:hypothetical protein
MPMKLRAGQVVMAREFKLHCSERLEVGDEMFPFGLRVKRKCFELLPHGNPEIETEKASCNMSAHIEWLLVMDWP